MIKELCHDEAILSQRCEVATVEDESVAQDLIDTIKSLDDAGCLAANQIGVTKKVCVYLDDAGEPHVLYNPRLVFGLGASKMEESCLTHEEVTKSTRYIKCKVAFDQIVDGKMRERKQDFVGFEAQMIQHMIDHCSASWSKGIKAPHLAAQSSLAYLKYASLLFRGNLRHFDPLETCGVNLVEFILLE